ncbi:MAG: hypothetical protein ACRC42_00715 [Mycoplasma sp.]
MPKEKNDKLNINDPYNYSNKLKIWRQFATYNKSPTKCDFCDRANAHKSVLLQDGKHVCWYSWIKKGTTYGSVVIKEVTEKNIIKKVKKTKATENNLNTSRKVEVKATSEKPEVISEISDTKQSKQLEEEFAKSEEVETAAKTSIFSKVFKNTNKEEVDILNIDESINELSKEGVSLEEVVINKKHQTNVDTSTQNVLEDVEEISKNNTNKIIGTTSMQVKKISIPEIFKKQNGHSIYNHSFINERSKKSTNIVFCSLKYITMVLAFLFTIAGIVLTLFWSKGNGNGFLTNFGVAKSSGILNSFELSYDFTTIAGADTDFLNLLENISVNLKFAISNGLGSFSQFNNAHMITLVIFSTLSLVSIAPIALFKRGTVFNLISMILSTVFMIVTMSFIIMGLVSHFDTLSDYYKAVSFANDNNAAEAYKSLFAFYQTLLM